MLKKKILKNMGLIFYVLLAILVIKLFPKENDFSYITYIDNLYNYIYLPDNNNYISKVKIKYKSNNIDDNIIEIINYLTKDTVEAINMKDCFVSPIPSNIKLIKYKLYNDNLKLYFNEEFNKLNNEEIKLIVESIIYSITEIDSINSISIYVSDKLLDGYDEILTRDYKINKEVNITSLNNIKEISITYLAKYDNFIYYVPVTKYMNTDKEKIEVIIDELKSSTTFNNNLVNFLNEDLILESTNSFDDSFILNFNESIFTGLTSNELIEEVTTSINDSIKNNYNYKTVIYYQNNSLINSYFLDRG